MNVFRVLGPFSRNLAKYVNVCETEINGIPMAFTSYGSTSKELTPLIIMHALIGCKEHWHNFSTSLSERSNCTRMIIAADTRNHGESPYSANHSYPHIVEDIKLLFDQQKIKRASLLGHSMGGNAAMYLALKYPNLAEKLIIEDISPVSVSPLLHGASSILTAMENVKLPSNISIANARKCADEQLLSSFPHPNMRSNILRNLIQRSDGSFSWNANISVLSKRFEDHVLRFPEPPGQQFEGPVLFVLGGNSNFVPESDRSEILKLFPNAEFEVIKDAGHWVHNDNPKEFFEVCVKFLNRS